MNKVAKVVATRSFESAVKKLKKQHKTSALKELHDVVTQLINYEITKQKSNHPLKNAEGHRDIHLDGGNLVLLYKYDDDVLTIALRLQDVVNHDELKSYDSRKYKAPARDYDTDDMVDSTTVYSANTSVQGVYNDPEEERLNPPDYDEPTTRDTEQQDIEVEINTYIYVKDDTEYDWVTEDAIDYDSADRYYDWAGPDGNAGDYMTEDGVYLDDEVGVVEHIDDIISPNVPTRPGLYHITGLATLVYDVSGIDEYRTDYGPDDFEVDVDTAHAVVDFNYHASNVQDLKITLV